MAKKSPIWLFYVVAEDSRFALCNTCKQEISRGGKTSKTFTTSNLVSHLKYKHKPEYDEYLKKKEEADRSSLSAANASSSGGSTQLTLAQSYDRSLLWDINDCRAQKIHRKIGEMVAIDCQPLSVVDDKGFKSVLQALEPRYTPPSRRYITENVLPRIHSGIMTQVLSQTAGVQWFSFTSDIWSTNVSNQSMISLTAHWLTEDFSRKSAVLNVKHFPDSHTGQNICTLFHEMFDSWKIDKASVHLIIRDNAANMVKAMADGGYSDFGCFAHTLQLIVHDGVLSQRAVVDTLAICRRIAGHFKHSPLATSRLKDIQKNLSLPQHQIKQDVPTRWNSTLYMLQSVQQQKIALGAYSAQYDIPQLTVHQFDLINKVITVLNPIEEITQSISSDSSIISVVIPFTRALRKHFESGDDETDRGVRTMKKEMLDSLNKRFLNVESSEALVLATILDPCFKDKFFTGVTNRINAKAMLSTRLEELTHQGQLTDSQDQVQEPSLKRPKTAVLKCLTEILEEDGLENTNDSDSNQVILEKYLAEPLVQFHTGNAYTWWRENRKRFGPLSRLALQYLSAPPTSVPSERLFSSAGAVYTEKRNRLDPEKAELLLFIKSNYDLIDGNYEY